MFVCDIVFIMATFCFKLKLKHTLKYLNTKYWIKKISIRYSYLLLNGSYVVFSSAVIHYIC